MKSGVTTLLLCSALTVSALAAPKSVSLDESGSFLIDAGTSAQIWKDTLPARVTKLYPVRRYRFVSEVTGGFNDAKTCVVSARAMLLPVVFLPIQGTKVVYAPIKSATAFDAVAGLSEAQCQGVARAKLKEAIESLSGALAAV